MGGGDVADVHIVVHEYGASHWTDQNRAILNTQIVYGFRNELVQNSVAATRAIMGDLNVAPFALETVVKAWTPAMLNFPHSCSPFL